MKLLILLLWLLFGYIGCRIAGINHEYMDLHIGDAFFLIGCGPLTFINQSARFAEIAQIWYEILQRLVTWTD